MHSDGIEKSQSYLVFRYVPSDMYSGIVIVAIIKRNCIAKVMAFTGPLSMHMTLDICFGQS